MGLLERRTGRRSASVNFFHNMGTGFDSAVGGKLNDQFLMHVDRFVDMVDGGAGEGHHRLQRCDRQLNIDFDRCHADSMTT